MRALYLAPVALILAACQSTGPLQPKATDDPSLPCFASLNGDPKLQVLLPKLGSVSGVGSPTMEMLNSNDVPTEDEKIALQHWVVARKACFDAGASFRAKYAPPRFNSTLIERDNKFIILASKLYGGTINYGQFIKERMELANETTRNLNAVVSEHDRNSAAQAQANAAREAQSASEINNALMLMQLSRPRPAPMMPPVSCSSRNVGGTVYTDCR